MVTRWPCHGGEQRAAGAGGGGPCEPLVQPWQVDLLSQGAARPHSGPVCRTQGSS